MTPPARITPETPRERELGYEAARWRGAYWTLRRSLDDEQEAESEIRKLWPVVLGALADRTAPVQFRGGILEVACPSLVWAEEMTLMEARIRYAVNAELGRDLIRSISFRAIASRVMYVDEA